MAQIEWIKISTTIFEDEKIKLLKNDTKNNFNSVIVVWFRLLCLAGKQNNKGFFYVAEDLPFNLEMFSTVLETPLKQLEYAFQELLKFKMLDKIDGVYFIKNWNKHQSLDKYEEKLKRDREYHKKKREEIKSRSNVGDTQNDVENAVGDSRCKNRREEKRIEKNRLDKIIKEEINDNTTESLTPYEETNCLTGEGLKERSLWCYLNCDLFDKCNLKKDTALTDYENNKEEA